MKNNDRLLDVSAVSKKLNLAPNTIRSMLRDPFCPLRGTKLGRSIRVYASSIEELLEKGEADLLEL